MLNIFIGWLYELPYELAVATFVGKNPGKLIYTVARNEKTTNVVIQKTKAVKSWAIQNETNVKKYGEAAWIFAPHVGEFDAPTYAYLEAAGLLENKSLDRYYQDVLVAKDKQAYYDIAKEEKEFLKSTPSISARRAKIADATRRRSLLKTANPLLEAALVLTSKSISEQRLFPQDAPLLCAVKFAVFSRFRCAPSVVHFFTAR